MAQEPINAELRVEVGDQFRYAITLGFHRDATLGFDHAFKEYGVPPVPSDARFDFRFLDPPSYPRRPSSGAYRDIRGFRAVPDTFRVRFRSPESSPPAVFTWSPEAFARCASAMWIQRDADAGRGIDMKQTGYAHGDAPELDILIVIQP